MENTNDIRPVIEASDLTVGYRKGKYQNRVQEHLNFRLYPGELTCLLGANGTGKSTLLRTLAASQPALSGELKLLNKPLRSYSERERSKTIGVVLTDKTFAGALTVYEVVALGRQPHTGFFGHLHHKDHMLIQHAIDAVGITHKAQSYLSELSDGERQKTMIAKALVQECPLIILDEPTAFLDVTSRIEIMTLLHDLAIKENKAILLSTHDVEQALVLGDKLWLMSKEHGVECGVTEDLIFNHRMDTLFERSNVRFDYDHGVYYPITKGTKRIVVKSDNEILHHWTLNALNRNGFTCETTAMPNFLTLKAISPTELILSDANDTATYHSFQALLNALRSGS